MIEQFLAVTPIEPPRLIEILKPKPAPIVEQVELTVTQKIESNFYECDTEIQYIRLDTAECKDIQVTTEQNTNTTPVIAKAVTTPAPHAAVSRSGSAPAGWYPVNQCTWHVWTKRPVPGWHDASTWIASARAAGWYTGSVPVPGAIGAKGNHVVYVEKVEPGRVYISERNYDNNGSYREMWRPTDYYTYLY